MVQASGNVIDLLSSSRQPFIRAVKAAVSVGVRTGRYTAAEPRMADFEDVIELGCNLGLCRRDDEPFHQWVAVTKLVQRALAEIPPIAGIPNTRFVALALAGTAQRNCPGIMERRRRICAEVLVGRTVDAIRRNEEPKICEQAADVLLRLSLRFANDTFLQPPPTNATQAPRPSASTTALSPPADWRQCECGKSECGCELPADLQRLVEKHDIWPVRRELMLLEARQRAQFRPTIG